MMYIEYSPGSQLLIRPEADESGDMHARLSFQHPSRIIHLGGWRQVNPLIGIHLNDLEQAIYQWRKQKLLPVRHMIKLDQEFNKQAPLMTK